MTKRTNHHTEHEQDENQTKTETLAESLSTKRTNTVRNPIAEDMVPIPAAEKWFQTTL